MKTRSWKDAIIAVLSEHGHPMHSSKISAAIAARGLKPTVIPGAVVAAVLSRSVRSQGSPFVRLGRGTYALGSSGTNESDDQTLTCYELPAGMALPPGAIDGAWELIDPDDDIHLLRRDREPFRESGLD